MLNQWRADRRKRKYEALRALCPHAIFTEDGKVVGVISSPHGTTQAFCQICHTTFIGGIAEARIKVVDPWTRNPEELRESLKILHRAYRRYHGLPRDTLIQGMPKQ